MVTNIVYFADDIVVVATGEIIEECAVRTSEAISKIRNGMKLMGLELAKQKTEISRASRNYIL